MNVKLKISDRQILALIWLVSITALAFAFLSEDIWDLDPCHLCIFERIPYGLVICLIPLIFVPGLAKFSKTILVLVTLIFATGTGLSVYHIGVEEKWWSKPEICSAPQVDDDTLEGLRKKVLATPVIDCSEVQWDLFGFSMAWYNALLSLFLLALSLFTLIRKFRE